MSVLLKFVRATVLGGVLFLMPFGVILVVLDRLLAVARKGGEVVHDALFPGVEPQFASLLVAIAILLLIAFLAGLFARTRMGTGIFAWFENIVLARLPVYSLMRQTLMDMVGGAERLTGQQAVKVVYVRLDDQTQVGFRIERWPDGRSVVFLPGAPSALSGTVAIVDAERVSDCPIPPEAVFTSMRRLGAGLLNRNAS